MQEVKGIKPILTYALVGLVILALVQQKDYFNFSSALVGRGVEASKKVLPNYQSDFGAFIDVFETDDYFLKISGWANVTNEESSALQVFLFLKSESDTLFFSSIPSERPDVAAYLHSDKYLLSGFNFTYPLCRIKEGNYQLGFFIEAPDTTLVKLSDKTISIQKQFQTTDLDCEELYRAMSAGDLSLKEFDIQKIKKNLSTNSIVGYIGDSLQAPFYELKYREFQYCLVPSVILMNDLQRDTIIGNFPATKTMDNVKNPLHSQKNQWRVLKDFGNGMMLMVKREHN